LHSTSRRALICEASPSRYTLKGSLKIACHDICGDSLSSVIDNTELAPTGTRLPGGAPTALRNDTSLTRTGTRRTSCVVRKRQVTPLTARLVMAVPRGNTTLLLI